MGHRHHLHPDGPGVPLTGRGDGLVQPVRPGLASVEYEGHLVLPRRPRRRPEEGRPEIFNTDQGAQFTSAAFSDKLEAAGVWISMDGRGRWLDNVFVERLWRSLKYEEVHLKAYANGLEARIGIGQWFRFYNDSRPHQALGYKTPAATWAVEVSPVDLPLRLDDAGASPTTPQDQQQQNVIHI